MGILRKQTRSVLGLHTKEQRTTLLEKANEKVNKGKSGKGKVNNTSHNLKKLEERIVAHKENDQEKKSTQQIHGIQIVLEGKPSGLSYKNRADSCPVYFYSTEYFRNSSTCV
jgi:hypothetical protein